MLKYLYIVFVGVLISLFVGVGIAAFYPSPKSPAQNYPTPVQPYGMPLTASDTAKLQVQDLRQQKEWNQYQTKLDEYNKNVAIITIVFAIVLLVFSIVLAKLMSVIADGTLLGAVFTLIYSIVRSFSSHDFKFIFLVVSIGLAIALYLGYTRFAKQITDR